ncbi:MAG TPA: GGDEF domain-containing protein [Candidatus Baltobacteraceae bacterium]|nr:GGDEF domain-containing protein [Candidatus Baltobacteraceae bacterium]
MRKLRDDLRRVAAAGALDADALRQVAEAARVSVAAVLEELSRSAATIAGVDGVLVFEESDGELACIFACGPRTSYYPGSRVALDADALPARVLRAGHRLTANAHVPPPHPRDAFALAVPLATDQGVRACIVFSASGTVRDEALERLARFTEQCAPAYRLALEREHDRRRAEYDALTGLLSPAAFRRRLATLIDRARLSPGRDVALLFVDSDRFKEWNDAYGHGCGDALLRELARELAAVARGPDDLAARNGGDEFCLVLSDCGKADAIARAEELRRRVARLDVDALRPAGARAAVTITASIGVAAFPADARSAHELLERADAAMYHTKGTGRDGVSFSAPGGVLCRLDTGRAVPRHV